jgi:hypothetical protein
VNLDEVTFIDRSGERVLRSMSNQGACLGASDVFVKHILDPPQRQVQLPKKQRFVISATHNCPAEVNLTKIFMSLPLDCCDQSQALDGVGGDDKFLMQLAAISSAACPAQLKGLEDSIAPKNLSFLVPAFYGERGGRSTHSRGRRSFDKFRGFRVRLTTIFVDRYPSFSFA